MKYASRAAIVWTRKKVKKVGKFLMRANGDDEPEDSR